tara:strand:- start:621 stop:791 length:171 start_codon:yes stop_codon:yes gene_type:complete
MKTFSASPGKKAYRVRFISDQGRTQETIMRANNAASAKKKVQEVFDVERVIVLGEL